jgi:hypothetical protein
MRIDPRAFGLAAGITAALITTVCATVVAIAPNAAIGGFGQVVHMDLAGAAARVSWVGYFTGLLFWSLFAGSIFGFAAWLYDRFVGSASPTAAHG